ncbi:TetR/AcrR family transcriptional regulator [Geodermatophilus sp. CPCC 206100]|uniref:TetR/AcrR family transcriptional regulator n=1 Tax=Geodermatophilus sp. CPCC 206100 TaxID=3020054 RepID=UPI003B00DC95
MSPRAPGRLRADLLDAAARLIETTGSVEAVTLRAVAREAGVTAPAVYGHFADLDALVDAVLEEGFAALRGSIAAAVAGLGDPVDRLVAGCRAYVRAGLAAPARYRAMFRSRRVPGGQAAFAVLVDAVVACQAAGRAPGRDADGDAVLVWTALHGVVTLRSGGPDVPWPDADEQVRALVTRLVRLDAGPSGDELPR